MGERLKADRKGGPMDSKTDEQRREQIAAMIERIKNHPRHGEPYAGSSEKAGRHPIKPDTGPALALATLTHRPRHIVEMGTAFGLSALWMGLGAPRAQITTFEFGEDVAADAQATLDQAGLSARVVAGKVEDTADEVLMEEEGVDMVFIDHNKGSYMPDFKKVEKYLNPGAVVYADNVNDRRAECQDFVDYMTEEYGAEIIPTEAGLLVAEIPHRGPNPAVGAVVPDPR